MKRWLIVFALALCLVPALVFAEPPKPKPAAPAAPAAAPAPAAPAPAPSAPAPAGQPGGRPQALPGTNQPEDIDWLSEFAFDDDDRPRPGETREQALRRRRDQENALDRMRRQDPKRYERLIQIRRLCHDYRDTDNPKKKAEIEKKLTPLVDAELRIQQENNRKRIAEMQRRLDEAKKVLDERDHNWDKVVEFSVKEITGQNAYLRAVHRPDRDRDRDHDHDRQRHRDR